MYYGFMVLVCKNCGAINNDPGGDPRTYLCGVCGRPTLGRVQTEQEKKNTLAALIAGGAIGALGGPAGILIGALIGAIVGSKVSTK
jgi:hypothetical protein